MKPTRYPGEITLPIPNPDDWITAQGAAQIIGVSQGTISDYVTRGTLTVYKVIGRPAFWLAEVKEVAAAVAVVRGARP